jgi:hypothetical protein
MIGRRHARLRTNVGITRFSRICPTDDPEGKRGVNRREEMIKVAWVTMRLVPHRALLDSRLVSNVSAIATALICLLLCIRGSLEAAPASGSPTEAISGDPLKSLPQDVLVGTDVRPLETLLPSRRPVVIPSDLTNEQGGGGASIQIRSANGKISLIRVFREPGASPSKKSYAGIGQTKDPSLLSGPGIEILGLEAAVLVHEKNSETDAIPGSLWILYERSSARKAKKP